jgi:hypothetical protein
VVRLSLGAPSTWRVWWNLPGARLRSFDPRPVYAVPRGCAHFCVLCAPTPTAQQSKSMVSSIQGARTEGIESVGLPDKVKKEASDTFTSQASRFVATGSKPDAAAAKGAEAALVEAKEANGSAVSTEGDAAAEVDLDTLLSVGAPGEGGYKPAAAKNDEKKASASVSVATPGPAAAAAPASAAAPQSAAAASGDGLPTFAPVPVLTAAELAAKEAKKGKKPDIADYEFIKKKGQRLVKRPGDIDGCVALVRCWSLAALTLCVAQLTCLCVPRVYPRSIDFVLEDLEDCEVLLLDRTAQITADRLTNCVIVIGVYDSGCKIVRTAGGLGCALDVSSHWLLCFFSV